LSATNSTAAAAAVASNVDGGVLYPPAYQLGLDMLFRLGDTASILRVLLARGDVLACLRLVPAESDSFTQRGLRARDVLAVAEKKGDARVFQTAFRYFQRRNRLLRKDRSAAFAKVDRCDHFQRIYDELTGYFFADQ
jgi:hypothetical protein